MPKFILPFVETQRGWFEFEADSLEHAKELAKDVDFVMELEPNYKDGKTEWDEDEVVEDTEEVE